MKVFIGYDERQPVSYSVLAQSIIEKTSEPVEIIPLILRTLPLHRKGLTPFTYSRFMVPYLCQYKGAALFLDADILARANIAELFDLAEPGKAVSVVKHGPERRYEWPSVMLFNCGHYDNRTLTPEWIGDEKNNPIVMKWLPEEHIGTLPSEWNHLVGYDKPRPDAKIVHFTQGIPAFPETRSTEYAQEWLDCFHRASTAESWEKIMGPSVHAQPVKERLAKTEEKAPETDKPMHTVGKIIAKGAVDTITRHEQMRTNLLRPDCGRMEAKEPHDGRMVIANYGPSLRDTWKIIGEQQAKGARLMSTSGAHDFLIERGIVPDFHAQCDPRPEPPQYVKMHNEKTVYLLASVVHPTVFEHLKGRNIGIWNLQNKPVDMEVVKECDPKGFLVVGGSTIGLTSISLSRIMGYRNLEIHGMDSSCVKGERHAGHHGGKPQEIMRVMCGGEWFETTAQMISQARECVTLISHIRDVNATFHGHGLLQKFLYETMRANAQQAA